MLPDCNESKVAVNDCGKKCSIGRMDNLNNSPVYVDGFDVRNIINADKGKFLW
jgi:hypothetical protein